MSTKSAPSSSGTYQASTGQGQKSKADKDNVDEAHDAENKPEDDDDDTRPIAEEFPWARKSRKSEEDTVGDTDDNIGTWQGRKLKRGAKWLKAQAQSLNHLLRHYPTNRYCETCRRTKQMKVPAKKRRYLKRNPRKFGDEGTCDHFIANNEISKGLAGEKYGLTYRDRFTCVIEGMAVKSKDTKHTEEALIKIRGPDHDYMYFYTDGAPEIKAAMRTLGPRGVACNHDACVPGRHAPVVERTNRQILEGTRALLDKAGLPAQFWPMAMQYYCLMENVAEYDGESSAYEKKHD